MYMYQLSIGLTITNSLHNNFADYCGIFASVSKKNSKIILEDLLLTVYAAAGKALARLYGKVFFISGAVPVDPAVVLLP